MVKGAAAVARKHVSICVLDDEPAGVERTTMHLEDAGFSAAGTVSPADALQKIRSGECRVVLADLRSPDMDGLGFLQKALQYDPGV